MNSIDYLSLYCGDSCRIDDNIVVRHPSVDEIREHGEQDYYNMVYTLCAVGADLKWQLDDAGYDYTEIDDFDLFIRYLCRQFPKERTSILLGDLDLRRFIVRYDNNISENTLIDPITSIKIDRYTYRQIVGAIRAMHGLKRNNELPGNEATKKILIEDAREAAEEAQGKEYKSMLLPLVSTLTANRGGDYKAVLEMPIYTFTDCVKRTTKIKNADLLLQSGYSGFGVDLKKIDKNELNYMGDLK